MQILEVDHAPKARAASISLRPSSNPFTTLRSSPPTDPAAGQLRRGFWRCQISWAASLLAVLNSSSADLFVDVNSPAPVPPFQSWQTAAVTLQEACDAALPGDTIHA